MATSISVQKLTLRYTFIDVDTDDQDRELSPRAHSDPGQPTRSHLLFDDHEEQDQQRYIDKLDEMFQCDSLATGENAMVGVSSECGDTTNRARFPGGSFTRAAALNPSLPAKAATALPPCLEEAGSDSPRPDASPARDVQKRVITLVSPAAEVSLAAVLGDWVAVEPGSAEGVWSIGARGRMLFDGKRFGSSYDVCVFAEPNGALRVCRNDGWVVDEGASGIGRLVWRRLDGCGAERIVWVRPAEFKKTNGKGKENAADLRLKMRASIEEVCENWDSEGRLLSATAVIEDVQRRICEDMDRAQSYIVDTMQSKVLAMKLQLLAKDVAPAGGGPKRAPVADKVVKNLEVIPTMVQNLLDVRIARAREGVRQHVQGMVEQLGSLLQDNGDPKRLAAELQRIAKEAVQLAGDAVSAAAHECQNHASKQLDFALSALRDKGSNGAIGVPDDGHQMDTSDTAGGKGRQAWEVGHDPWRLSRTIAQALAVVQDKDHIPQSFANQVVADQLLRARIRSGGGGDKAATASGPRSFAAALPKLVLPQVSRSPAETMPQLGVPQRSTVNVGSRGHPDICRPCIFHTQGNCTKGEGCGFCHISHPKRPVRFDKLHRETLKRMSFERLVDVMLPVLRQKYEAVMAHMDSETRAVLGGLWTQLGFCVETQGLAACADDVHFDTAMEAGAADDTEGDLRAHRRDGSFTSVLLAMALRPLLATLATKVPHERVALRAHVEAGISHIHGKRGFANGSANGGPAAAVASAGPHGRVDGSERDSPPTSSGAAPGLRRAPRRGGRPACASGLVAATTPMRILSGEKFAHPAAGNFSLGLALGVGAPTKALDAIFGGA
mmetsp:Transcript_147340/g.473437  ORF Transcript_147340/g.473437 Transcript_147340/m.473437 type:complete len:838 (-) Transcript_147340:437-2950(-)|eukprot:CAMPEP_0203891636 /NCGR_PEP_ID=MMETSP0359-20131031/34901_1 /ASSEMBLY_ACC=CAM_ASM_000338 /TAXON_ID=268821 /ORGANISM="Scrippsiella Hangoei, Strain SHTV-5" /LENGTH=837 /DNA_ID=CAMNT_0050813455 /DNA_START=61 /DNA_END=2574 /DNA_ORIENTATION=-